VFMVVIIASCREVKSVSGVVIIASCRKVKSDSGDLCKLSGSEKC